MEEPRTEPEYPTGCEISMALGRLTGACVFACPPDQLLAEGISQAAASRINYQLVDFGFRLSDIWKNSCSESMGKIKNRGVTRWLGRVTHVTRYVAAHRSVSLLNWPFPTSLTAHRRNW